MNVTQLEAREHLARETAERLRTPWGRALKRLEATVWAAARGVVEAITAAAIAGGDEPERRAAPQGNTIGVLSLVQSTVRAVMERVTHADRDRAGKGNACRTEHPGEEGMVAYVMANLPKGLAIQDPKRWHLSPDQVHIDPDDDEEGKPLAVHAVLTHGGNVAPVVVEGLNALDGYRVFGDVARREGGGLCWNLRALPAVAQVEEAPDYEEYRERMERLEQDLAGGPVSDPGDEEVARGRFKRAVAICGYQGVDVRFVLRAAIAGPVAADELAAGLAHIGAAGTAQLQILVVLAERVQWIHDLVQALGESGSDAARWGHAFSTEDAMRRLRQVAKACQVYRDHVLSGDLPTSVRVAGAQRAGEAAR